MNWTELSSLSQLEHLDQESKNNPVLILKHSTRCGISSTALNRIERNWTSDTNNVLIPYYLDLLKNRDISNAIETRYGVQHESPQVLIIFSGKCVFSQTHSAINLPGIIEKIV